MNQTIKVLSIHPPWSLAVALGLKPIENRPRRTSYRGRFLVHSSKTYDDDGFAWLTASGLVSLPDLAFMTKRSLSDRGMIGAVVGEAVLIDCVESNPSPWFFGPIGYRLKDALRYQRPIPLRGELGFFDPGLNWFADNLDLLKLNRYGPFKRAGTRPDYDCTDIGKLTEPAPSQSV